MAEDTQDLWGDDLEPKEESYSTRFTMNSVSSRRKSSAIPGATDQCAIFSTSKIVLHDTITAFISYSKTCDIPILPVTKPDIRTVLGQGASFLVNGSVLPSDYVDPSTGKVIPEGTAVAMKRARFRHSMKREIADRISVIYNELLTMMHPPLRAHPNIVDLVGVGFETEGSMSNQKAVPVLFAECAELGNLADVLETARKEERPLTFHEKLSLCTDVAHALEILHACDIVHGDVKCENILVFERDDSSMNETDVRLQCKLTDFGALQLDNGDFRIGGSRPWQAPEIEIKREAAFKVENAKRTDIYGFGMLVWRTMLDGDPFKSLQQKGPASSTDTRQRRNAAIAEMKKADTLVNHCIQSLADSDKFSKQQLRLVSDVINATLHNDARNRELDLSRIIRLLSYDMAYEERHPVKPSRMAADVHIDMIDIEKWYSEFESASPVVQDDIMVSLEQYAQSSLGVIQSPSDIEEKGAAAYQLAICCANSFGGKFRPEACIRWLEFATRLGSPKARAALRSFEEAFPEPKTAAGPHFKNPFDSSDDVESVLSSSWATFSVDENPKQQIAIERPLSQPQRQVSWLTAAQNSDYPALGSMLEQKVKLSSSSDGVSALHFLSSWDLNKASQLGDKFIQAGADVNAVADRGSTIGGTPLMWSVYGDHIEHSRILLEIGAEPLTGLGTGENALILAARLHLADHLQLLLEHVRPAELRKSLPRLLEAAAGGDSRFTRIIRHGTKWQTAASKAFSVLQRWAQLFADDTSFEDLIGSAVLGGASSAYGRVNVDVQLSLIKGAGIQPRVLSNLLRHSVVTFNKELFDGLLDLEVPLDATFEEGRNLLHLCARIPDHSLAATAFAPRLIELYIDLERKDDGGLTPWMDAVLERKWDLADLFLQHGADPLQADINGDNIVGLCIQTVNLGALKFLMKYTGDKDFKKQFFVVNETKQITSLQLASSLTLPRAHGMKVEVMGTFLTILQNFAQDSSQVDFRSDGLMTGATALEIAASRGIVHAVRHLVKKDATLPSKEQLSELRSALSAESEDYIHKKNLERCIYIIESYGSDPEKTMQMAADWTNLKTIDESKVESSWENIVWKQSNRELQ